MYADLEPFWADLTAAYAEEVRRLGELGCTYLQFDDTSLAYLNDPEQRAMIAAQGGDAEAKASADRIKAGLSQDTQLAAQRSAAAFRAVRTAAN